MQGIMFTPKNVDIAITAKCNLKCKYCYFFDIKEVNYIDLPTDEWIQFIEELGRCSVMSICIGGGEPLLRSDLPDLINSIVKNRMRFSILTNGTLIDHELANFIAGTGRCDEVQVSLDGASSETHDYCRGRGSYYKAIKGILTLRDHDIPIGIRVTIHRGNLHDLENIAHLIINELKLKGFSTNSACPIGACKKNADQILLRDEDRNQVMNTLINISNKYPGRITASSGPLADARFWKSMEESRARKDPTSRKGGRLTSCGAAFCKVAVRSDGIIVPCAMLSHLELGKINRDSLADLWKNSPILEKLRARNSVPLNDFDFCRDCGYIPYCRGGCPGIAYSLTGIIDHPNPDTCFRRYLANGGTLQSY